jgi:hypothetical protein
MVMIFVASMLIGASLGLRFGVFALVPAVAVAIICIAAVGWAHGDAGWAIVSAIILAATGVQLGYLGGAAARVWRAAPGLEGPGSATVPDAAR